VTAGGAFGERVSFDERQEVTIDQVWHSLEESMGPIWIDQKPRIPDEIRSQRRRICQSHDLILRAPYSILAT